MKKNFKSIKWLFSIALMAITILTSCDVAGDDTAEDVTLTSIAITSSTSTVEFEVGDNLDTTGLVVTATYSDNSTEVITIADLTMSGFDSSAPVIDQVITVSYMEKTASFTININESALLTSITITSAPTTTEYVTGESLDTTGLIVTAIYNDTTEEVITTGDLEITGFNSTSTVSDQVITVTYQGQTATYTVDIVGYIVYLGGEDVDLTVSSFTVNGTEQLITSVDVGTDGTDGSLTWDDYRSFASVSGASFSEDFTVVATFTVDTLNTVNVWDTPAVSLKQDSAEILYIRGDAYSSSTLSAYPVMNYDHEFNFEAYPFSTWTDATVMTMTMVKTETSVVVTYAADGTDFYIAAATPPVEDPSYALYIGGEDVDLTVSSITVDGVEQLTESVDVGTNGADGTLTWDAYGSFASVDGLQGDFILVATFTVDTLNAVNNWDTPSTILMNTDTNESWYLRGDNWSNSTLSEYATTTTDLCAYVLDSATEPNQFTTWTDATAIVMTLTKTDSSVIISYAADGTEFYTVTATPAAE